MWGKQTDTHKNRIVQLGGAFKDLRVQKSFDLNAGHDMDQTRFKCSLAEGGDSPGKFVEGCICCTVRSMTRLPRSREDRKAASFSLMIFMTCPRSRTRVGQNTSGSSPAQLSPSGCVIGAVCLNQPSCSASSHHNVAPARY